MSQLERSESKFFQPAPEDFARARLYSTERFTELALTYIGGCANEIAKEEAAYVVEAYLSLALKLVAEEQKLAATIANPASHETFLDCLQQDYAARCSDTKEEIRRVLAGWQPTTGGH